MAAAATARGRKLGRYVLFDEIAAGGMATVHLGRLHGSVKFARTVAIKRLHPMYAKDPVFVAMFTDEAKLAARVRHSNVATTLDVVSDESELFVVMEYIHGDSLSRLLRVVSARRTPVPVPIAVSIAVGILHGLHAAHEATTETGEPLRLVHRDVSPQNVLVGVDGVARLLDFGIARAVGRAHTTQNGELRGKMAYMAPEQLQGAKADRRVDVYAASVVLWETLTGHRLFAGESGSVVGEVLGAIIDPPSRYATGISVELDAIVLRGLSRDPAQRFQTASAMAEALERAVSIATTREVGEWVATAGGEVLAERAERLKHVERAEEPAPDEPPRSEASEVTPHATVIPTQETSPRGRRWPVAVVVAVAAVLGGALALTRPMRDASLPPGTPASSGAVVPPPAIDPAIDPALAATTPVAAPSASSAPGVSVAPAPPTSAADVAPRTSLTGKAQRPTKRPPAPKCDPPYTIDKDGFHVPKPDCG